MFKVLSRSLVGIAALVFVSIGLAADAKSSLKEKATITEEQAAKLALSKVHDGKVKSSGLEQENNRLVWSFDITTPGTKNITEVQVDAKTAEVVSIEIETPEAEAREAAAEKQGKKTK